MRKSFLFILFICSGIGAKAQVVPVIPSSAFSDSLGKIIRDFRHNFHTIQGVRLPKRSDDMDVFESKTQIPGVSDCAIYRFHSGMDTTASWQGIVYNGSEQKQAIKIYKNIVTKIKKSKIKWIDNTLVGYKGEFSEPDENLSFAVTTLTPNIDDPRYSNFFIEVELVSANFDSWEVRLNLVTKMDASDNPY